MESRNYSMEIRFGKERMHREREDGVGKSLTMRKIAASIAVTAKSGLQMQRYRVVNAAFDATDEQCVSQSISPLAANDKEVIAGLSTLEDGGKGKTAVFE